MGYPIGKRQLTKEIDDLSVECYRNISIQLILHRTMPCQFESEIILLFSILSLESINTKMLY
jgi:hypothetical protein